MPSDPSSIAPLVKAINVAAASFLKNGEFESRSQQRTLISAAQGLAAAVREPKQNALFLAPQVWKFIHS